MSEFADTAIVLTLRPHGENGAIIRLLTMSGGLRAGYVPGAHSKRRRALLLAGNRVALRLRARSETQLPTASLELLHSRALLAFDATTAAILQWVTALTATTLAENVPHDPLAEALEALLAGLDAGMGAVPARAALACYELLLLQECGFGLDWSHCALGGPADDLAFISPKTGRAVSRTMANGQPWREKLLPLAAFLRDGHPADAQSAQQALALSWHFLSRHWHFPEALLMLRARAAGQPASGPLAGNGAAP